MVRGALSSRVKLPALMLPRVVMALLPVRATRLAVASRVGAEMEPVPELVMDPPVAERARSEARLTCPAMSKPPALVSVRLALVAVKGPAMVRGALSSRVKLPTLMLPRVVMALLPVRATRLAAASSVVALT